MTALDALFRDEVDRQAYALRQGLELCERLPPNGELLYATQALKGAARVVDISAAERLADGLEQLLGAAEAAAAILSAEQLQVCAETLELIEAIAQAGAARVAEVAPPAVVNELLARLNQPSAPLRAAPRATPSLMGVPATTRELFRQECDLHCAALSDGLLLLEREPDRPDQLDVLDKMMRGAHSLKGAARAVGLDAAVSLAHAVEDQLERARHGRLRIGPDLIDALLAASDLLKRYGTAASASMGLPDDTVVRACGERITRIGLDSAMPSAGQARPAAWQAPPSPSSSESALPDDTRVSPTATAADEGRVLRIRATQLSRLVALSGELVVQSRQTHALAAGQQRMREKQLALADLLDTLQQMAATQPLAPAIRGRIQESRLRLNDLRVAASQWAEQFDAHALREEDLSLRLYREAIDSRMRPVADGLANFPRLVHDLGRRLGKQAVLTVSGEHHRIDRDILERIEAPLNHLLRNALDHGLEKPAVRRALGKPERGDVRLSIRPLAGSLEITVSDDGAGIDINKVRARLGAMGPDQAAVSSHLSEDRLLDYLFVSGFSTAEQVTEISGRGVGLAVVRSVMRDIGGAVQVETREHAGALFRMRVPISRSVLRVVVVSIAGDPYAFPMDRVERLLRVDPHAVCFAEKLPYLLLDNHTVPLVPASEVLDLGPATEEARRVDVVVVREFGERLGFTVDAVLAEQDLVLVPLDARLGRVPHLSAAGVLPDGRPVLVVDAEDMARSVLQAQDKPSSLGATLARPRSTRPLRVLVVDDSSTIREMERTLLAGAGYHVTTATNGMEAWHSLRQNDFQLVVTDVDMPLLDGLDLIRSIRGDERLRELPVIVVSYRASAEDRQGGLQAGANVYLTKAEYNDDMLLESVATLIGQA